ncbi:hypothetical protein C8Q80DRAFT_1117939 [Daedaleopsis nitida]|nr:hypothetical protein C8Q80DRAFT_1117939 [Daedaleopsis nitida]
MEAPSLTRHEILCVLKAMGIDLPVDTKLSDNVLDKRLRDALDASQYKEKLSSLTDLSSLPIWPVAAPGDTNAATRSVYEAVRRGNMHEARQNEAAALRTGSRQPPELFVDPFMDLRQTIMSIGGFLDNGARWWGIRDQQHEQCAINMRVISVREVDAKTPAIVVLYRFIDRSSATEGVQWILRQSANASVVANGGLFINATPLEQKVVLKVLKSNAHLVPPDFVVDRQPGEERYKVSVLLPVGPLDFDVLAKLNEKQGCVICGKRTTSRCAQCQSVSYCGAECQRADWKAHKPACRSLKGGRWCTATVRHTLPGLEDMFLATVNKFSASLKDTPILDPSEHANTPPPNVWGDKLFLVKIQIGLNPAAPRYMMLYDMKRSFQVFLCPAENPLLFENLHAEMTGPRGGYGGIKMYRWAKRTGDWQFDICVDRDPQTDIKW